MWRANATILFVLVGVITAIGLDTKPWPFNNYPMFAHTVRSWPVYWARGDVAAHLALIPLGVDGEEPQREHVLKARHVSPHHTVSTMMSFNKMLGNWKGSIFPGSPAEPGVADLRARAIKKKAVLRKALLDLKERYNRRRQSDEPPLIGMRLYLMKRDYSRPETLSLSDAVERGPTLPAPRAYLRGYARSVTRAIESLTLPSPKGRGNNGEKRLFNAWNNLWFQPWGPENLGLSRALVSGLFLWSHLSWDLSVWTEVSDAFWMPIPLFRLLGLDIPSAAFVQFIQRIFLISLTLGFVGLFTRTAFAISCFTWLYVFGMRQSFGSIAPAEGHFILMFGIFAMSRCGDAFSFDHLIRRLRGRPDHIPEEVKRGSYSWPVRLMQLLFVSVFFAGGVAKMRLGGLDWIFSDNLALAVQVIDLGPLSHWLAGKVLIGQLLAVMAVGLELASVLAFFSWRARIVIVPCLLLLQVGFAVTMRALFQTFFLTYAFWIPWDRLLDMARGSRSRRRTLARLALAALLATFVGWTAVLPWVLR